MCSAVPRGCPPRLLEWTYTSKFWQGQQEKSERRLSIIALRLKLYNYTRGDFILMWDNKAVSNMPFYRLSARGDSWRRISKHKFTTQFNHGHGSFFIFKFFWIDFVSLLIRFNRFWLDSLILLSAMWNKMMNATQNKTWASDQFSSDSHTSSHSSILFEYASFDSLSTSRFAWDFILLAKEAVRTDIKCSIRLQQIKSNGEERVGHFHSQTVT